MKFAPKKKRAATSGTDHVVSSPGDKDHVESSTLPSDSSAKDGTVGPAMVSTYPPSRHRFRTRVIAFAAVVFSFGAGFALRASPVDFMIASSANTPKDLAVPSTVSIDAARDAALAYHGEFGTFRGFTSLGVLVASSDTVLLLAAVVDGVCSFTKIVDGVVYETSTDTTLETCSPATLDASQAILDEYRVSAAQAATSEQAAQVEAAAYAAVFWASLSFDAYGNPSLHGLQDLQVPGTKVLSVSPDGQSVSTQVLTNGSCLVAVLSARPGVLPKISGC